MAPFSNSLINFFAQAAFKSAKFADDWIGLPSKVSETLHFRRSWKDYLPKEKCNTPGLWIHGASVGELENLANFFSNPKLLEEAGYSPHQVIITASSISARAHLTRWFSELKLRYAGPLPPESYSAANLFFSRLNPDLLVMSHTDVWPLLLARAKKSLTRGCLWLPKENKPLRLLERSHLLPLLNRVALRTPGQLRINGIEAEFLGNPRVDRIVERIEKQRQKVEHILESRSCAPVAGKINILFGSAWAHDAKVWAQALKLLSAEHRAKLHVVVIPHEVHDTVQVATIQSLLSELRVLPVSGVLLEAYQNFQVAYVGGAFGSGLHSILEPALWGVPVFCGPDLRKQPEAARLKEMGVLRTTEDAGQIAKILREILTPEKLEHWHKQALMAAQTLGSERGASLRLAKLIRQSVKI